MLLAWLLACTLPQAHALPVDGEEKCSPSGTVLRYRDYSGGWVDMGGHCQPDLMRDLPQHNEYTGRPIDGEVRCAPDGDELRYREYNQRWNRTGGRCPATGQGAGR